MELVRARALAKLLADSFPQAKMTDDQQKAYAQAFSEWQHEMTTYTAIRNLTETEKWLPSIALLREEYRLLRAREHEAAETRSRRLAAGDPEGYGKGPPEWIHVWYWLRTEKGDFSELPQQQPHVIPISSEEYEKKRQEWLAAGAPKANLGLMNTVAAMAEVDRLKTTADKGS